MTHTSKEFTAEKVLIGAYLSFYRDENLSSYIRTAMLNMSILLESLVLVPNPIFYKVTAKASIFRRFLETAVTSGIARHGL